MYETVLENVKCYTNFTLFRINNIKICVFSDDSIYISLIENIFDIFRIIG